MSEKEPFFSVIIPAHNSEEYIGKGIQSIKDQRFTDYELIIVCDACTDRTEEIARGVADKVIVTDYGLDGMARNAGIEAAEGKYILFMDDDDWFLHEFVFEQIHAAMTTDPTMDVLLWSRLYLCFGVLEADQHS